MAIVPQSAQNAESFGEIDGVSGQRRLLMLVPSYPSMPRPMQLAKHLGDFGWSTMFLAPSSTNGEDTRFAALASELECPVVRTYKLRTLSERIRGSLPNASADSGGRTCDTGVHKRRGVVGWLDRLARRALLWMDTPDAEVGWIPFAMHRGSRLIAAEQVDAIYATGPPFSVVLAGALLKRRAGIPFVADFRDAWVQDRDDPIGTIGGSFSAGYGRVRVAALSWIERFSLRKADAVLFSSGVTKDAYERVYPEISKKALLIYNGVEETECSEPVRPCESFTFAYIGTMHKFQYPQVELFLKAFHRALRADRKFTTSRVFIGGFRGGQLDDLLKRTIQDLKLDEYVALSDILPHRETISHLKGSDVLLLFSGKNRFTRLSKISDYAATRRTILALADEDSETARAVREVGGTVHNNESVDELAGLLGELFKGGIDRTEYPFPFSYPHPLLWKCAAENLADKLNELTSYCMHPSQCGDGNC